MKIPNHINMNAGDAYLKQSQAAKRMEAREANGASDAARSSGKQRKDEIILSSQAAEVRRFEGMAKAAPQIRQEKVEAIRKQVQSQTYNVDGKLVARSIADLLV